MSAPAAGILYSIVSRGVNVLAEATAPGLGGNFASVTRVLLKKIDPAAGDTKMSYAYDEFVFHYQVAEGLTILAMTEKQFSKMNTFAFIANVEQEFTRMFGNRWRSAAAYAFEADFKAVLSRLMQQYSTAPRDSKIDRIQSQLDDVKNVMSENINKVLERGEKIEILVTKSETMESHALKFNKTATKLKKRMCWKNAKWTVALILIILIIAYAITAFACGGPHLPKCV